MPRVLVPPGFSYRRFGRPLGVSLNRAGQRRGARACRSRRRATRSSPKDRHRHDLGGRVVAADSGQPLRKAQVRMFPPELRENRLGDDRREGRYEFNDAACGPLQVSASKGSYVSCSTARQRPFEPGKPLEVAGRADDREGGLQPAARRASSPAACSTNSANRCPTCRSRCSGIRTSQGRRRLVSAGRTGMTNDIGEFRIFGLVAWPVLPFGDAAQFQMADTDDRSGYAPTYYPGDAPTPNRRRRSPSAWAKRSATSHDDADAGAHRARQRHRRRLRRASRCRA